MRHHHICLSTALSLLLLVLRQGCLRLPDPHRLDGAAPAADAGSSPTLGPFEVTGWTVRDRAERAWPADAAPRSPIVRIALSQRPEHLPDEDPPVWLLEGPPDDDLDDDLSRKPLRVATRERIVPCEIRLERSTYELIPRERLRAGGAYAVVVAPWLRSVESDETLIDALTAALSVSEAPEAGAEVTASWPADGAAAVAPSIPELAVRFDGPIAGLTEGVLLFEGASRLAADARAVDCPSVGWPDGWCVRLRPSAPLARGAAHRLVVGAGVTDATGAPAGPWEARFSTALEPDVTPPELAAGACAIDAIALELGCLFVDDGRFALTIDAREPARMRLSIAGQELVAVAPRGVATLSADGLPSGTELFGVLRVEDQAGLETTHALRIETLPPLLDVSIVEVRGDPSGREPHQEYVEVVNFGTVTVDLAGLDLSDRADALGTAIERPQPLAPGQRALLVGDAFDPEDPADVPAPPGALLVRMGRSVVSGGILNAGEALYLRDAEGRRISASPALAPPGAGECIRRVGDDMRSGDVSLFVGGPCTPGTGP